MNPLTKAWLPLKGQMEERWGALNSREQKIIGLLAIVTCIWLTYNVIIQPVLSTKEQAERKLQASQASYQQASALSVQIAKLKAIGASSRTNVSNAPLDALIGESAGNYGITIQSITQQNGGITLRLAPLKFTRLTQWLTFLDKERIAIENLKIDAGKQSGVVEVKLLQLTSKLND